MARNRAEYQRRYIQRLREKLTAARGNKCEGDGCHETAALEWAHVKPTKLSGRGRGQSHRLLDVQKNPDSYLLLCPLCHGEFDDARYSRADFRPSVTTQEEIPF